MDCQLAREEVCQLQGQQPTAVRQDDKLASSDGHIIAAFIADDVIRGPGDP